MQRSAPALFAAIFAEQKATKSNRRTNLEMRRDDRCSLNGSLTFAARIHLSRSLCRPVAASRSSSRSIIAFLSFSLSSSWTDEIIVSFPRCDSLTLSPSIRRCTENSHILVSFFAVTRRRTVFQPTPTALRLRYDCVFGAPCLKIISFPPIDGDICSHLAANNLIIFTTY